MAAPSVTYTFANSTTADASQVNTNFTNIINALTDGTSDITIGTLSCSGNVSFSGNVTLGNATADDLTITASLASSITVKTNTTYDIGSATSGLASVYLGGSTTKTTRIKAGTVGTSWTFTLPNDVPTITGQTMVFNTAGTAEFRYPDKFTAAKTTNYTATGDETVILCDPTTGGASFTVTLPAASTMTGKMLTIVKVDSGLTYTVTIDANSSETILPSVQSGQLTYILYTQYESVTLKCNGTSWYVVSHYAETPWASAGAVTINGTTADPTKPTGIAVDRLLWMRRGALLIGRIEYKQSNTTSAANGTGDYIFSAVPSGATIDTSMVTVYTTAAGRAPSDTVGNCIYGDNTSIYNGGVVVYDSTRVRFTFHNSGGTGFIGQSASLGLTLNANLTYQAHFTLPMANWNP